MNFLTQAEIGEIGFKAVGSEVLISRHANFYGASKITLGNYSRIDDFTVLSAGSEGIILGQHVHIGTHCTLIGQGLILLDSFSGLSGRVSIYSSNDDYSGKSLTNPTTPTSLRKVFSKDVLIGRHAIIGTGTVIMPGVTIGEGTAIGAMSFVNKSCADFGIYAGNPVKYIRARERMFLELEKKIV